MTHSRAGHYSFLAAGRVISSHLSVSSDVRPNDLLNLVCPACRRSPVKGLAPSERGAYCACEFCGHKWQQEGLRISWRQAADHPTRRKSDRPDRTPEPEAPTPCSHCGRVDEEHERRVRHLLDRIAVLEADSALLRDSARTFGELADRLNQQLRRRNGHKSRSVRPNSRNR